MNSRYLGDCFDFYKHWFLHDLLGIAHVVAIPMFSSEWSAADCALYECLVGVTIIQECIVPNRRDRADYFLAAAAPAHVTKDVFLDPDTGFRVRPGLPARRRYDEYLFAAEVRDSLLPPDSTRLAVIYDQSVSRGSELESATQKLRVLRSLELYAFAYCAQVAMIGVSRNEPRVRDIVTSIRQRNNIPQDRFQAAHELNEAG